MHASLYIEGVGIKVIAKMTTTTFMKLKSFNN